MRQSELQRLLGLLYESGSDEKGFVPFMAELGRAMHSLMCTRWIRWIVVMAVAGLAQACSTAPVKEAPPGFDPPQLSADSHLSALQDGYALEHAPPRTEPKIGLALSGGGTRAAYFALGVMVGLNDTGAMDHVDAIASVSGGGYAALWYVTKRTLAEPGFDYHTIFTDCFPAWIAEPQPRPELKGPPLDPQWGAYRLLDARASQKRDKDPSLRRITTICDDDNTIHYMAGDPLVWQAYLARWPSLLSPTSVTLTGDKQKRFKLAIWQSLVRSWKAALFGADGSREAYEAGIRNVWWRAPAPRHDVSKAYMAKESYVWHWTDRATRPIDSFDELQQAMTRDSTLPLWIIDTNVGQHHDTPDPCHLFELTPYAYGSCMTGYAQGHLPEVSLVDAATLSGAFFDARGASLVSRDHWGAKLVEWLTLGDLRWGRKVTTPGLKPQGFGLRYRLSDGGGEDNLGLYSLVRRGIRQIIVVDGEQDAPGQLGGLCRNWTALDGQGWTLDIENLKSLQELCKDLSRGIRTRGYDTSRWLNPVMRGTIVPKRDLVDHPSLVAQLDLVANTIQLLYIKLGWDQLAYANALQARDCETKADDVSCFVTMYYGSNTCDRHPVDQWLYFPQLTTVGMTKAATSYQFWAFRELGREAGRRIRWDAGTLTVTGAPERPQRLLLSAFPRDDSARAEPNPHQPGLCP